MKTQSNAMLIDRLYKQITHIQCELEVKRKLYTDALEADEPFEKSKALRAEIKSLTKSIKELEAQVIISNHLAEYSN
ncbi:MAG TPA: hypothetical protein VGI61_10445 [Parafilimonas sp.]